MLSTASLAFEGRGSTTHAARKVGWTVRIVHPGPLPRLADLFREAGGLAGLEITGLDRGADGGWRLHGRPVAPVVMTRAEFRELARALASNSEQFPNEEATNE